MLKVKEVRHKRVHAVWYHLYKDVKLTFGDTSQYGGILTRKGHMGTFCGDVNVLYVDLAGSYTSV